MRINQSMLRFQSSLRLLLTQNFSVIVVPIGKYGAEDSSSEAREAEEKRGKSDDVAR